MKTEFTAVPNPHPQQFTAFKQGTILRSIACGSYWLRTASGIASLTDGSEARDYIEDGMGEYSPVVTITITKTY